MPRGILALHAGRAPARVLVVRLSHLGDVLHALPVFHAARARFPAARLAWAVQREYAPLLAGLAGLERTIELDRRGGAAAWLAFARACRAFDPELAIDAQGNVKSGLATLLSRAPLRLGAARIDWRERIASAAVNARAEPASGPHAVDRARALCAALGWAGEPSFELSLSEREREAGRVLLAGRLAAAGSGGPLAILALARGGDVRSWPLERWAECAEALVGGGARVLALSGPEEEAEGRAFAARLGERARIAHWIGQRGLRELAACFAAAAELGGVLVACDSGPMHLGWTQGLRVVLLAGPQDPARTGPWPAVAPGARAPAAGSRHAVVRADAPPACAPCRSRRCSHPAGPVCMAHIDGRAAALAALASGQAPRSHA